MWTKFCPLFAIVLAMPGCFFVPDDHHVTASSSGTLVVDWTIHGAKDPALCALSGAQDIDIILDGTRSEEYLQRCTSFATSIDLLPGHYAGGVAVLLDSNGADRTTEVELGPFTIYGNDVLTIPIDFPASSFY